MGQAISCLDCIDPSDEDEAAVIKKNALIDIKTEVLPKPSFERITTRSDPTNKDPSLRRAKLDRSKSQAYALKQQKVNIHARFLGRHGVFVADTIFDEDNQEGSDDELQPEETNKEKTEHEVRFIEDSLTDGDNFVFEFMTPEERAGLIDHMDCICYRKGSVIIKQGDAGDYFYVIKEGAVGVYASEEQQEKYIKTMQDLGDGDTSSEGSMAQSIQDDSGTDGESKRAVFAHNRSALAHESIGAESSLGSSRLLERKDGSTPQCEKKHYGSSFDNAECNHSRHHVLDHINSPKSNSPKRNKRKTTVIALDGNWPSIKQLSHRDLMNAEQSEQAPPPPLPLLDPNQNHICDLGPGDTFGELALLYNCPRMATCIANEPCSLWRVKAHDFRRVMAGSKSKHSFASNEFDALEALKKVKILSDVLDEASLARMADSLVPIRFKKGERICTKGEVGDSFYIVASGDVLIHNIGHGDSQFKDVQVGPGEYFGERSLLSKKADERRSADITAISDTVVTLVMSKEQFEIKLGSLKDIIHLALLKKKLMTISSFADSEFDPHQFEALAKLAKEVEFEVGHTISIAGKRTMPALYFILSGSVQISNEKKGTVNVMRKDDYFGGESLQASRVTKVDDPTAGVYTSQTIEVMEPTRCAILTRQAIEQVIGSITRLGKPLPPISAKLDRTIKLDDLKKHRILGIGSFGSVWMVEHRTRHTIYALKVLRKQDIIQNKMTKHVIREKNIMMSVDHPLIVNLVTSFQNSHSLYMVQNFIQGGELFTVIHKEDSDGVSNDAARFYCACILESLSHLHKRNICYRDLKPENVLIDKEGYCILIDLGFAKLVLNKTHTLCGTPEYLAPELILHKGHNKEVDDWALGVLLYEMIVGQSPFASPGASEVTLFRKIVNGKFPFPDREKHGIHVTSKAKDLIRKLVKKNPIERLGSLAGGSDDIKNHPYFENMFENDDLVRKKIEAPWKPTIKDALDASNFETYRDDSPRHSGMKLTKRQQELFADF